MRHSIREDPEIICPQCGKQKMERIVSSGFYVSKNYSVRSTLEDHKESEHNKKVKDPERAIKMRKKAFGHDEVGDPSMQSDPRHVVKRGRVVDGQQTEVNKDEFIKAAAKDPVIVEKCQRAIDSQN